MMPASVPLSDPASKSKSEFQKKDVGTRTEDGGKGEEEEAEERKGIKSSRLE
jgi:hypothetical protein